MSACISPSDTLLARRLIELTQAGLPLVADPWAWIAAQLRLSEAETLALLKRLRDAGVILCADLERLDSALAGADKEK